MVWNKTGKEKGGLILKAVWFKEYSIFYKEQKRWNFDGIVY